ncbi:10003_t:CDS:2 [Gigaspora margarita]|uniref:10003_t:CDS:1 n=1 Tax=Gigaspora margarita TaxID=4874 RepID=A0ABN7UHL0_GIGMA|nr:10003_t:CDS:2 [Gigaspora margarita]
MELCQNYDIMLAQTFVLLHCNIVIFLRKVKLQIAPNVKREGQTRETTNYIEQLKPTVILYGDTHFKGIPEVKALIKGFARAVHDRNGCIILVNITDVVNKG